MVTSDGGGRGPAWPVNTLLLWTFVIGPLSRFRNSRKTVTAARKLQFRLPAVFGFGLKTVTALSLTPIWQCSGVIGQLAKIVLMLQSSTLKVIKTVRALPLTPIWQCSGVIGQLAKIVLMLRSSTLKVICLSKLFNDDGSSA